MRLWSADVQFKNRSTPACYSRPRVKLSESNDDLRGYFEKEEERTRAKIEEGVARASESSRTNSIAAVLASSITMSVSYHEAAGGPLYSCCPLLPSFLSAQEVEAIKKVICSGSGRRDLLSISIGQLDRYTYARVPSSSCPRARPCSSVQWALDRSLGLLSLFLPQWPKKPMEIEGRYNPTEHSVSKSWACMRRLAVHFVQIACDVPRI